MVPKEKRDRNFAKDKLMVRGMCGAQLKDRKCQELYADVGCQ